jgi:hypothetical protein
MKDEKSTACCVFRIYLFTCLLVSFCTCLLRNDAMDTFAYEANIHDLNVAEI